MVCEGGLEWVGIFLLVYLKDVVKFFIFFKLVFSIFVFFIGWYFLGCSWNDLFVVLFFIIVWIEVWVDLFDILEELKWNWVVFFFILVFMVCWFIVMLILFLKFWGFIE